MYAVWGRQIRIQLSPPDLFPRVSYEVTKGIKRRTESNFLCYYHLLRSPNRLPSAVMMMMVMGKPSRWQRPLAQ
ncbi:jg5528 [Pararge aegeria aegeria]|uniref:Jg5528 protein n=1 Tax=Pararge aegeria aegeria TaxID=348720 RepID=A0A8S4SHM5_9NEOP|nr:jg5528 [Pararge aegeria aegeria]